MFFSQFINMWKLLIVVILTISTSAFSEVTESGHLNIYFDKHLGDDKLKFCALSEGDIIDLNEIIIMPRLNDYGFLSIEFDRSVFSNNFINDVFYKKEKMRHSLTSNGIELILDSNKLIINLYSGIILNLREDMGSDINYLTFNKNIDISGVVKAIKGEVLYAKSRELIKQKLNNIFVIYRGPIIDAKKAKGTNEDIDVPLDNLSNIPHMPEKYEPKIIQNKGS